MVNELHCMDECLLVGNIKSTSNNLIVPHIKMMDSWFELFEYVRRKCIDHEKRHEHTVGASPIFLRLELYNNVAIRHQPILVGIICLSFYPCYFSVMNHSITQMHRILFLSQEVLSSLERVFSGG